MTGKSKSLIIPKRPELLSPAGSPLALHAAIEGGADAVYMGGAAFNARINAKNFSPDELSSAIRTAHGFGVKIYITLNTLVYDRELDEALFAAEDAYLRGADALIVADMGLASEIKKRLPIELHASTQMSGHNVAAAKALAEAGFSRMVCAREMWGEDLKTFVSKSPIEAEVFVHGALCVSHSGQCLFSSIVGGRSGNRGECAQPCRLPFANDRGKQYYPLSLKDLSLAEHIPELCRMGIASFKIEGRMKSPEYVREVTSIWRRLIDEDRGADREDMERLASVFSRGGFTDGYYKKKIGKEMLGVRSENDKESSRTLESFSGITRKIDISMKAALTAGEPLVLTAYVSDRPELSVTVMGGTVMEAINAPMNEDGVRKCLGKLGGTFFSLKDSDIQIVGRVMMPVSLLNAARREVTEALSELICGSLPDKDSVREAEISFPEKKKQKGRSAVFYDAKNIPEEAYGYFDVIYLPLEKYRGETGGVVIPPVIYDSEREQVDEMLKVAREMGAEHALVGNIGHISLVKKHGFILHGDHRLNICNSSTASVLEDQGFEDYVISPELTLPKIRDIDGRTTVIVYGRLPLMLTEKCVGKECGGCEKCESGRSILRDRRGVEFPVLKAFEHRSIIFNSVPVYMADREKDLVSAGIESRHFLFTTETATEVKAVIEAYKKGTVPSRSDGVRRIK
ncbi:MAG: U32 family peptidase [Clostridia bacterium]|nr:U32 family peptidase [Clostridia bacterium]